MLLTLPLWGQQMTDKQYEHEIASLRERLQSQVIFNQENAKEQEAEIMRLSQEVNHLQQENASLRKKMYHQSDIERHERIRVTERLEMVEGERARIDGENTFLQQKVASLEGELRAGRIQMQHKEANIKSEFKALTDQLQKKLDAAQASQAAIEAERESLRRRAQAASVEAANLERAKSNLETELNHLANGSVEERQNLEVALEEAQQNIENNKQSRLNFRQRIDSLKYELDGMGRVVSVLSHMDKIERSRLAKVEELERKLAEAEVEIQAERKMLESRTNYLIEKEVALAAREQRYGEIQAREAALIMLEQRLKAEMMSPSSRR